MVEPLNVELRCCQANELGELIALLDLEFIFQKDREISLSKRFPQVLNPKNCSNIYVAYVKDAIASTATVKRFAWSTGQKIWQGVMVGMVYTKPEFRGQGLASLVMQFLQADLKRNNVDFAVLWTGVPNFYARLGWHLCDRSSLGELQAVVYANSQYDEQQPYLHSALDPHIISQVEQLRQQWSIEQVLRSELDYATIPIPASSVDIHLLDIEQSQGYALVGNINNIAYVYEVFGNTSAFGKLLRTITEKYSKVYINEKQNSSFYNWLIQNTKAQWQLQTKTMWFFPSNSLKDFPYENWYIPFFDRI